MGFGEGLLKAVLGVYVIMFFGGLVGSPIYGWVDKKNKEKAYYESVAALNEALFEREFKRSEVPTSARVIEEYAGFFNLNESETFESLEAESRANTGGVPYTIKARTEEGGTVCINVIGDHVSKESLAALVSPGDNIRFPTGDLVRCRKYSANIYDIGYYVYSNLTSTASSAGSRVISRLASKIQVDGK